MPLAPPTVPPPDPSGAGPLATLLRDRQDAVPLGKILAEGDIVLLLSPVVAPLQDGPNGSSDPFEPLGRAIEARHPWIHHVPYNKNADMTRSHAAFIARARVVIFIVSGPKGRNEPDQWELAEASLRASERRTHVVLACYEDQAGNPQTEPFPTLVQASGYLPAQLQAVGALLFGEDARHAAMPLRPPAAQPPPPPPPPPKETWTVVPWTQSDTPATHDLWVSCLPRRFHLEEWVIASLLIRDGYAMHHVVRDPASRRVLGFCASYLTFADGGEQRLLGSLALILVREGYQGRGIGTRLHNETLRRLKSVRGVDAVQLGSLFPRLLRGVPTEMENGELSWFERRGWDVYGGELISDFVLDLDVFSPGPSHADLAFQSCGPAEFDAALALVEREAARGRALGVFDQYARLTGTLNIEDVVIGLAGRSVVACALVYAPGVEAPAKEDLPWATKIGEKVGGATCVCVASDDPDIANYEDAVIVRLLEACAKILAERGTRGMFVDGIKGGEEELQSLGFTKWATYRDVWQRV